MCKNIMANYEMEMVYIYQSARKACMYFDINVT